jgi:hypothetical protein
MLMKLLREPLVHFIALGAGLFILFSIVGNPAEDGGGRPGRTNRIVVTAGHIERLVESWKRTWQRPPTPQELNGLIQDYIREEILSREALALGLDRNDTIIRRRLRQKMEFLFEDITPQTEPTNEELQAYLAENPDRFRIEPRLTFTHVYLNPDRRGTNLQRDVERLLAELSQSPNTLNAAALGDAFLLAHNFKATPESEVTNVFGNGFAASLLQLERGQWKGPIESGYGMHLVLVSERIEGRVPALEEVRDAVQRELLTVRRNEVNEATYRRLRDRYSVTVEMHKSVDGVKQASREAP